jgi:hypothetical protein
MYLASATRPDISFAVSKLSRFVSNPGDVHWQALCNTPTFVTMIKQGLVMQK